MMTDMSSRQSRYRKASARLLRYARRKEHLTQRGLAERSGVPQETIARIEGGKVSPLFETLARLLDACGFELGIARRKGDGVDRSQIRELLRYGAAERAAAAAASDENVRQLVVSARRR